MVFIGSQHGLILAREEMFPHHVHYIRALNVRVIIEIKRGYLRVNHIVQFSGDLTAFDMTEKRRHENPTIGTILCQDSYFHSIEVLVREYVNKIGRTTYRTAQEIPENLR